MSREKEHKVTIQVSSEDKKEIKEAAKDLGQSMQDFILNPAIAKARNHNVQKAVRKRKLENMIVKKD